MAVRSGEHLEDEGRPGRKRRRVEAGDDPLLEFLLACEADLGGAGAGDSSERKAVCLAGGGLGGGRRPALISLEELQEADFSWTVIDGRAYALDDFIPRHPGGALIWRGVGTDASDLFHAHHASQASRAALAACEIGAVSPSPPEADPARVELNRRAARLLEAPATAVAEAVALCMLALFAVWAYLVYAKGWLVLNIGLGWFWWRHLDAGLHAVVHGDFRYSKAVQRRLLQVYSVLCHHMLDYYRGGDDRGLSQHYQHHLFTNDAKRDPDVTFFAVGRNWVRRHPCNPWQAYNAWQGCYWLAVLCVLEPATEVLTMLSTCFNGAVQALEAPADAARLQARLADVGSWWAELLLSPGYQGAAFLLQPWRQALMALMLSKALGKLVLLPFAQAQHFLVPPEAAGAGAGAGAGGGFVRAQLRTTASLRLRGRAAQALDFLMFHGDSLQVEHHLWPAMSFVRLREASQVVRDVCQELDLPYLEVGYWEAFGMVLKQVREHASQPE